MRSNGWRNQPRQAQGNGSGKPAPPASRNSGPALSVRSAALRGVSVEAIRAEVVFHGYCNSIVTLADVPLDPKEPHRLTRVPYCHGCERRLRAEELRTVPPQPLINPSWSSAED